MLVAFSISVLRKISQSAQLNLLRKKFFLKNFAKEEKPSYEDEKTVNEQKLYT